MRRDSDKYAEEHENDDKKPETIDDLMKDEEPAEEKKPSQDKSEDEK